MAHQTVKKTSNNRVVAAACVCFVAGMVGMSYAAVPLYELFCQVTGYGGTTQVAEEAPKQVLEREVTVRFDANVASGLNWEFKPVEQKIKLKIGEIQQIDYEVVNLENTVSVGTSSFNVSPNSAGAYFNKMQCFCFTEQVLQPGERIKMPVVFFIDPEYVEDPDTARNTTITLSYTFFRTEMDEQSLAQFQENEQNNIQ